MQARMTTFPYDAHWILGVGDMGVKMAPGTNGDQTGRRFLCLPLSLFRSGQDITFTAHAVQPSLSLHHIVLFRSFLPFNLSSVALMSHHTNSSFCNNVSRPLVLDGMAVMPPP